MPIVRSYVTFVGEFYAVMPGDESLNCTVYGLGSGGSMPSPVTPRQTHKLRAWSAYVGLPSPSTTEWRRARLVGAQYDRNIDAEKAFLRSSAVQFVALEPTRTTHFAGALRRSAGFPR